MIEARGLLKHYRSVAAVDNLTSMQNSVDKFLPMEMAENSLTAAHTLSPGISFGLLRLYAAVVLGAGALALARRDA